MAQKCFGLFFFRVYGVNRDCLCLSKCRQSTCILSVIIHLSGIGFMEAAAIVMAQVIMELNLWYRT